MKNVLKKILFGDIEIQEYSTVTIEESIREQVFLENGNFTLDVSKNHWLLCLQPIVFGIWIAKDVHQKGLDENAGCSMYFASSSGAKVKNVKQHAVAIISLDYFQKIEEAGGTLYLLKLKSSRINHVNFLKTFVLYFKYYKKPGLSFKKYKSLIAAYSFPRRVRVISFKQNDYFNIFPMDLLGEIPGTRRYIFGLRHTNVALAKIIESKKIVVSEVPFNYKSTIYDLGKHHSSGPPSVGSLPFATMETELFKFPIPVWADGYKEVKIIDTKSLGSHMLLYGEIVNEKFLKQSSGNLYHIHFLLSFHQKLKGTGYKAV